MGTNDGLIATPFYFDHDIYLHKMKCVSEIPNCEKCSRSGFAANTYLFKVSNRNTRKKVRNMFKVHNKNTRTTDVVPVSLLLTLIVFSSFCSVFYC